jgi:uncharacterized protein YndB with AHSA1/START domain
MPESFAVSDLIPASPERVYSAWLDGAAHSAMTGGAATCEPRIGGRFTAWDGYIEGTTLEIDPGRKRIVQSWRSADFPEGAGDSRLEVVFESEGGGTRLTIRHSEIPEGQGSDYEQGWREHYFTPMRKYFSAQATPKEPRTATLSGLGGTPTPVPVAATPEPAPLPPPPSAPSAQSNGHSRVAASAKKAPAKKAAAAKKPAKKPAAKKPAAKKPAAKKPAKKAAAAKKPAKKPAAKKPAAKKPTKKPAAKKAKQGRRK